MNNNSKFLDEHFHDLNLNTLGKNDLHEMNENRDAIVQSIKFNNGQFEEIDQERVPVGPSTNLTLSSMEEIMKKYNERGI
jgi:hypothetical protein